jgi:hypothetical protein
LTSDRIRTNDESRLRLFVEPMDATVVAVSPEGLVRFEREGWSQPTLQERRAILFAAEREIAALTEIIEILQKS